MPTPGVALVRFEPQDIAFSATQFSTSIFGTYATKAEVLRNMIAYDFNVTAGFEERITAWRSVAKNLRLPIDTGFFASRTLRKQLGDEYDNLARVSENSEDGAIGRARWFARATARSFRIQRA